MGFGLTDIAIGCCWQPSHNPSQKNAFSHGKHCDSLEYRGIPALADPKNEGYLVSPKGQNNESEGCSSEEKIFYLLKYHMMNVIQNVRCMK
jgi:hypothetical protein